MNDQAQRQLPFVHLVGQNGGQGSERHERHIPDGLTTAVEAVDAKLLEGCDANEDVALAEHDEDLALFHLIHDGGEDRSLVLRKGVAAKQAKRDGEGRDAGAPG